MSLRIKICGLQTPTDAELAIELGARYLGIVLAPDSPRCATIEQARAIAGLARDGVDAVLVFRKAALAGVLRACDATGVRRVQIHGISPVACRLLAFDGVQSHPVFRVRGDRLPAFDPLPTRRRPAVLDGGCGGSGIAFDWNLLGGRAPEATLIAGGIDPENVGDVLRHRPFGIDVSSGIESAPGVKDHAAMRRLFEAIAARVESAS